MNIFDFAIKMEGDGKALYEKLAAETGVSELKTIFTLLAAAEDEHCKALNTMKKKTPPETAESKVLESARSVFEELVGRKTTVDMLKEDPDGYLHALKFAMAGVKLYETMAAKETNPEAAKIFTMLADEERKHLQILENIYDFVEAPKDYLAWGEFSNLKEF